MPNWNVPDTLTPAQATQQPAATPYAAMRAKNPLPPQPQVTAPQNQMPQMNQPAATIPQTPRQPAAPIVRPTPTAIGYGAPGNPQRGYK